MEEPKEQRQICASCAVKILKAAQDIANYPVQVGDSVDTECEFVDDATGQSFKLYLKLTNQGIKK